MAIMNGIRGLTVEVHSNGQALREYDDPDEEELDGNEIAKYIQAKSRASFMIRTIFSRHFQYRQLYDIVVRTFVDGQKIQNNIISRDDLLRHKGYVSDVRGLPVYSHRGWVQKPFLFAAVETDNANVQTLAADRKKQLDAIGSVEVRLYRVHAISQAASPKTGAKFIDPGTIPEKALKGRAISHKLAFGEAAVPIKYGHSVNTKHIDPLDKPFACFTFKYRSMHMLKASFVVPRSPTPVPLEDRAIEDLTSEEMRELLRRERAKATAAGRVKREVKRERQEDLSDGEEDEDGLEDSGVSFVRERPRKATRTVGEIGVIDLTDG